MPKLKTNRGAAKRFRKRASGSIKCRRGFRNHILTKMSQKRKRHLRHTGSVDKSDMLSIERLLHGS